MKSFLLCLAVIFALLCAYLASYWIYDYSGLISSPGTRLKLMPFYEPCRSVTNVWDARRQRQKDEQDFYKPWEGSLSFWDAKMSINKDGQLTIKYAAQTIRGTGKFEEIDGSLYFVATAKCLLDKESQSYPQVLNDHPVTSPINETCRFQIHVFQSDNRDKFQLASHVLISNLKETESYGIGVFYDASP